MKTLFKKLITTSFICLAGMGSLVEAKWSISKNTDAKNKLMSHATGRTQSHFVQIFSSINPTKAEGMKNTLEIQGYPAFIRIQAELKRPYYQVQIGPFNSKHLARSAKISLVQLYPQYPFLNEAILKKSF